TSQAAAVRPPVEVKATIRPKSPQIAAACWIRGNPERSAGSIAWGEKTTMQVPANFTQLLTEWRSGQPEALDRLTPLVYEELRRLARNYMRGERGSHTLQATAVVHEAFLRLIQANVALQDRGHFFALASRLMRRVLVDHAKSRSRIKRNSGLRDFVAETTGEVL